MNQGNSDHLSINVMAPNGNHKITIDAQLAPRELCHKFSIRATLGRSGQKDEA
jgi:hypothetical protein